MRSMSQCLQAKSAPCCSHGYSYWRTVGSKAVYEYCFPNFYINLSRISRPFACEHCDKSFPHKTTLYTHMRIHTGNRLLCTYCSKVHWILFIFLLNISKIIFEYNFLLRFCLLLPNCNAMKTNVLWMKSTNRKIGEKHPDLLSTVSQLNGKYVVYWIKIAIKLFFIIQIIMCIWYGAYISTQQFS